MDQIPDDNHRDLGVKYIIEKMNLDVTKIKPENLKCLRNRFRRESVAISAQCQHDPLKILMAGKYVARRSKEKDFHAILNEVLKTPTRPTEMLAATLSSIIKKLSKKHFYPRQFYNKKYIQKYAFGINILRSRYSHDCCKKC